MTKTYRFFTTIICLLFLCNLAWAQDYPKYYTLDEMPDAGIFLPAPPDFDSPLFANDFYEWQWGKLMHNDPAFAKLMAKAKKECSKKSK